MITLNLNPSVKERIRSIGKSIQVCDNLGNHFGSELRIFFSKNPKSKFAVLDYELPKGAGKHVNNLKILDEKKHGIYRTKKLRYEPITIDEYLCIDIV